MSDVMKPHTYVDRQYYEGLKAIVETDASCKLIWDLLHELYDFVLIDDMSEAERDRNSLDIYFLYPNMARSALNMQALKLKGDPIPLKAWTAKAEPIEPPNDEVKAAIAKNSLRFTDTTSTPEVPDVRPGDKT